MNKQVKYNAMYNKATFILAMLVFVLLQSCNTKMSEEIASHTQEKFRPNYHFTPETQWMNDPNGMVYYNDEYHLFYQYYPDSTIWGPMHWGHAVSKDLVIWEHLPVALYPDEHGLIFSGSAVIDHKNTSGLGSTDNPAMVAIYTYHNMDKEKAGDIDYQTQGIAYSTDSGRTWTKYENNPVLMNPGIRDFRDPKVIWHEETQKWIMALAVKDRVGIYSSPNLIDWKHESDFGRELGAHGGVWECPDLFPMQVEGSEDTKWVMIVSINPGGPNAGSATQYFLGDFDGFTFSTNQTETKWLDYGTDNYAGVTWSNTGNERYFIGWMNNWKYANIIPTEKFRGSMTTSRKLSLKEINGSLILTGYPVENYKNIANHNEEISDITIRNGSAEVIENLPLGASHISFTLSTESSKAGLILKNSNGEQTKIIWNQASKNFTIDRTKAGISNFHNEFAQEIVAPPITKSKEITVDIFTDNASIEVFVNKGQLQITAQVFPNEPYTMAELFSDSESHFSEISITEFK